MSFRPISINSSLPASCVILAVKVAFAFRIAILYPKKNGYIIEERICIIPFLSKMSKNAKDSHNEHGYKKLFYSMLVFLLNAGCFT